MPWIAFWREGCWHHSPRGLTLAGVAGSYCIEMYMVVNCQRRAAFVTGGASGIGLSTAQLFLERGWAVALADTDLEQGERAARELSGFGSVCFIPCDVSQPEDVQQSVGDSLRFLGRIDLLVNNAGILGPGDFVETSDSDL